TCSVASSAAQTSRLSKLRTAAEASRRVTPIKDGALPGWRLSASGHLSFSSPSEHRCKSVIVQ
ncbi:Protein of unknown function, partial [Gryllus bimaculatus]